MTAEQQGVSPATTGGASAPDVAASIEEVPPHPAYVENAVAGALTDMYGFLPLSVRYGAAAAARAAVESWQRMTGPAAVPDPRDAEIERLRTALARYQKRLGDDLLSGGRLVERVREALRVDNGSTCTRASMDGVAGDVGRLCDEIERLRADVLVVQQHLQRAHGQPDSCVTTEYMGPDFSRAMVDGLRDGKEKAEASLAVEQRNLLNEMDEHQTAQALLADAREEWKRADAEVTRLKRLVGNENVDPNWDCVDRAEAIRQANEFHADRIKWMGEHEKRVNEVGRLYGRLDNQRAEVERANADTIRAIKDRDAAEAERDRLRQQLDQHLADENSAQAANDRLCADLASERAIYADSPDDRLYHAADHTWWRRNDEGRLVRADTPAIRLVSEPDAE